MIVAEGERERRGRAGRGGADLQGLRLRRQGGARRHGPRPEVVMISVDLPAAGVPRRDRRLAVHALPGVPRLGRRDRRHPPRPRPVQGALRPRDRQRRHRGAAADAVLRPGDQGPGRAAGRVPRDEPAHGDRRRRVRLDAGDRHARGPARGDRRRDRGRVRPSGRVAGADRRPHGARRRHVPDRRLQRAVRGRELPQEDYHTLAGFVFGALGRAPEEGDEVVWNGLRFGVSRSTAPASSSSTSSSCPRRAERRRRGRRSRSRGFAGEAAPSRVAAPPRARRARSGSSAGWRRCRGSGRRSRRSSAGSGCAPSATCSSTGRTATRSRFPSGRSRTCSPRRRWRSRARCERQRAPRRRRLALVEARVSDGTGEVKATWFNQAWLAEKLQPGTRVRLRGLARALRLHGQVLRPERRRVRPRTSPPSTRRPRT